MMDVESRLNETAAFLNKRSSLHPRLGFVLGSGLSGFAKQVNAVAQIPFKEIPHFAPATVEGHPGQLILGTLEGIPVAVLQGRLHAYEGLDFDQVIYPTRTLAALGVKTLVVTNAAGGLKKTMKPGDFMVIKDHINLTGENPLRGPNWNYGPRFVDMTAPYDPQLIRLLREALRKEKARASVGVYVGVMGPTYETAAEISFYGKIGGGSVGMSTVAEVIAARHAGMRVAGLSCITNLGTGLSKTKLSHEEVKEVAGKVESKFIRALLAFTRGYQKLK
ncbi:MAG TPA: purine-nucleoside phosphorylase [Bdellovibrionales bacterium]|nr:purine-nucleoside phosphorylase [Bdellovibrionales bacterium]